MVQGNVQSEMVGNQFAICGSGVPITAENLVEFHLLYSGPLHSAGYEGARREKHAIRKALHPQLRRLWMTNNNLRLLAQHTGMKFSNDEKMNSGTPENAHNLSGDELMQKGFYAMGHRFNRNGFNFVPLVTKDAVLRCELEILFLRVEEKNYVLQGGDIDGRLKILFDGLRMQREGGDLPPGAKPEPDEDPLFCLLENDDLISGVTINAAQLLQLPENKTLNEHDVYLQITVRLNPTVVGWGTYIV